MSVCLWRCAPAAHVMCTVLQGRGTPTGKSKSTRAQRKEQRPAVRERARERGTKRRKEGGREERRGEEHKWCKSLWELEWNKMLPPCVCVYLNMRRRMRSKATKRDWEVQV